MPLYGLGKNLVLHGSLVAAAGVALLFAPARPGAAAVFGCATPLTGSRVAKPFGFDPGLKHRCLASAKPGLANFYEDRAECSEPGSGTWTVANHSGPSCSVGPDGQKFPVNDGVSPIKLDWMEEVGKDGQPTRALRMVVDLETREHPCWQNPQGTFTWLTLQNNPAQSGEPLPRPDQLEQVVHLYFKEWNAGRESHTRMGVSAQVFWDGVAHLVEIDLYTSPFWGDADPAADVIVSRPLQPGRADSGRYVLLDGRFLRPTALGVEADQGREIRVRWHQIFADLIQRGLLPAPRSQTRGEDPWESTATGDVAVFSEVFKQNASPLEGAIASVTVRDFRVEPRPPERGPYVAAVSTCDAGPTRLVVSGSGLQRGSLLQLFNRFHIPVGAPIEASRRRGNRALLFDLDASVLALDPAFLRVVDPALDRASNFARTPPPE